jgi:flagellar motor switch/type III secretory pathway protein FliN
VTESFQPTAADLAGAPIESRAITYSRSLLRIRVPVIVTLASKKQPIARIVELGPGAIIHFEKSCEEMLDLEVGGQTVAQGEPVKVGDKFGIRLTSLTMPHERFLTLAARDKR